MREATGTDLLRKMKEIFSAMGVVEHFTSDEGSQFTSGCSAYFPHTNLRVETAVKSAKCLIRDNTHSDATPNWGQGVHGNNESHEYTRR